VDCLFSYLGEVMDNRDIEHMWKVASNNPNHDTNWHDPIVIAFAALVEAAARADEREACAKLAATPVGTIANAIRARGTP
jgi:hypothetical protein